MSFATPWGLLALLAIPAVLWLHMFRRRLLPRRVAGLFLFAPELRIALAGRRRTRLLRSPSLWLELLAALLLSLWLGGLRIDQLGSARHAVFVLDDTASMWAKSAGDGESRAADRAAEAVRRQVAELPAGSVVTLIRTGVRPEILLGPRAPTALLEDALRGWRPASPNHDPALALHLGHELAAPPDDLWFLTDALQDAPERYRVLALGQGLPNAAIMAARRLPSASAGRELLLVDVQAFAGLPVRTSLLVTTLVPTEPVVLARQELRLDNGKLTRLELEVGRSPAPLRIALADDALELDNQVALLPEPSRTVAVAVLLPEAAGGFLQLPRVLAALPDVRLVSDPAAADLRFTAGAGRLAPGRCELVFSTPPGETDSWLGPFLLERRDELLEGVTLEGVVWTAGRGQLPGLPLVLAGSQPLLSREASQGGLRLWCNLDPARSNLPSSPDFPILCANLIERARAELPGPVALNLRVGEVIGYTHAGEPQEVRSISLREPDGERRIARGIRHLTFAAHEPGTYVLEQDGRELCRYSVQFVDAAESDLLSRGGGERQPVTSPAAGVPGVASGSGETEHRFLVLLLLLLVAADWWVLARGAGRPGSTP